MAPKASGRTSARSSSSREQASSPPDERRNRDTEAPVGRRTRSARSQSVESQDQNVGVKKTRRGTRSVSREGSADSVGSKNNIASSRGGRARQTIRVAAIPRDLSMVAEDRELEESQEEEVDADEVDEQSTHLRSPGAASQMSGTTAVTSHSQSQLAEIDPTIAELLPDLFKRSENVLDVLVPENISEEVVQDIVNDLMAPGSNRAKRLKYREDDLKLTKTNFGSDVFVNRDFVLRKLFGSDDPGEGAFRPDAILYSANLATLASTFLGAQKKSSKTLSALQRLDRWFSEAFVLQFGEDIRFGGSRLLEHSFAVGLEIRTQYVITDLETRKDLDDFDPEKILAGGFYMLPDQQALPPDFFEDALMNAEPKDILEGNLANSTAQIMAIHDRVNEIRDCFRQSEEAIEAGDAVDFDQLEGLFPWSKFLTNLIDWVQSRFNEIKESINQQGGLNQMEKDLQDVMADIDSQSQTDLEQHAPGPAPRHLQPSAPIVQSGTSLNTREGVLALQRLKMNPTGMSSSAPQMPSSSAPQRNTAPTRPSGSQTRQSSRNKENPARELSDDFRPDFDDGEEAAAATSDPPASEYTSTWQNWTNEKNKENLGIPKPKRTIMDPQPGAQSVAWNSQNNTPAVSSKRRRQQQEEQQEEEEEEESVDGGFEEDRRIPDPSRKTHAPSSHRLSPVVEGGRPSKRARTQGEDNAAAEGSNTARRRQERAGNLVRNSSRSTGSQRGPASDSGLDERVTSSMRVANRSSRVVDDEPEEAPIPSQIAQMARDETSRRKIASREPGQRRSPWTENDAQRLVSYIEEYGASWAIISRLGGWEREYGQSAASFQVALKDKARNLKVNWLKAGIPLPQNFNCVRLDKKAIEAVRRVIPDYVPEP